AADVLQRRAGLLFTPARRPAIERALEQSMKRLRVSDPGQFVALLGENGAVFDEVVHYITIGETYFFREPAQLDALRDTVFPALRAAKADRELRIWSAACASGEEAYSLAIAARNAGVTARILGTDVDRTRLAMARRGRYRQWSFRGMRPDEVDRYFVRDGQDYCLRPEIRRAVAFSALNLIEDQYPVPSTGAGIEVIFCRNVLIYFSTEVIERVCRRLLDSLSPDGWLFVGASDPPVMNHAECDVVQTPAGLAYQRRGASRRSGTTQTSWKPAPLKYEPTIAYIPTLPAPVAATIALPAPQAAARPVAAPSIGDPVGVAYASRDYNRVVELGSAALPARTATLADLALTVRAYGNLGRLDDAERFCIAALDRAPESSELHALHASLLLRAGHARPAAVAARRALYLDRDFIMARIALGDASARLGDAAAAMRAYSAALRQLDLLETTMPVPGTDGESRERVISSVRDRMKPAERAS
ncbi:MAG: protein-glutamate O-methyltransferase CheR, partial [Gemmatimonadaceae bacterium]